MSKNIGIDAYAYSHLKIKRAVQKYEKPVLKVSKTVLKVSKLPMETYSVFFFNLFKLKHFLNFISIRSHVNWPRTNLSATNYDGIYKVYFGKLDGVGPVDNRPFTYYLHHFVKKEEKKS